MTLFGDAYRGKRVLVTGHTGFKGSWLSTWLETLGAEVYGLSLDPETSPNHWDLLDLKVRDNRGDIRDMVFLEDLFHKIAPEVVFHLAAQPLVRRSYREPLQTLSINIMGTANVLEACRRSSSVKAIVVVTTDKCYENREWVWGYRETDPLGGHDPYSTSKAGSELVTSSYRRSFFNAPDAPLLASARAGNVIGGGDWSEDRLLPDLVRSVASGAELQIRSPQATRPWQHVLDCLSGYLLLGQKLLDGERAFAEAWNFGPDNESNQSVAAILAALHSHWPEVSWSATGCSHFHEAGFLYLDSAKAKLLLGWQPVWSLSEALEATASWYRSYLTSGDVATRVQLCEFINAAKGAGINWAQT